MWKAGALLILLISVVTADDHGSEAVSYTAESFATEVEENKHFVMFFAPWCGHCKRLAPTWNELAKVYNEKEEPDVIIAKVDCTVETGLCAQNDVTGYPTLKFFPDGKDSAVRYKGPRDLKALQTFIEEQLGKKDEPEEEEEEEGPTGPLYVLDDANFAKFTETGNHFIKFFAPWCGHCKRMAPTWEELAKAYENDDSVVISKVDCTVSKQICSTHGVRGYPTLLFFRDGQKVDQYSGSRELPAFQSYIEKMVEKEDGKAESEEEKIPEKAPEIQEGEVFDLNPDIFPELIMEGVTFVKFFAPWCGHCKRLAPTWEDLSKKYADIESVKIAKVDCTQHKSLCSENKVRGYPTLILFKNGERQDEYNGGRDLESLSAFLDKFVFTGEMRDEL